MTYVYQWMGMTAGYAFLYGCMLGLASPSSYFPQRTKPHALVKEATDGAARPASIE